MNLSKVFLGAAVFAASLLAQSGGSTAPAPGARLKLAPSEPLTDPRLAIKAAETAKPSVSTDSQEQRPVRPAILKLKPAADPIYLVDETEPDANGDDWRTYRRPKVEPFSRTAEGIAIQGYDAVSYFERRAEKGRKEFSFTHGGVTWYFASAEHRYLFSREPERYVPAYGGFCAYSIAKGYPATADPRVFAVEDGRLYLFFDAAVRAVWEQDENHLLMSAARNWPRLHR